jgi:hypothetical protein
MGCDRRLTLYAALAGALFFAFAACGTDVKEQQRRELLTPPNKAAIQAERKEKAKVVDEEGALLASDLVLGGFTVPRGFELTKTYKDEWVLQSKSASARATASYVDKQVFTGSITRTSVGGFRFESAQIRHNRSLPSVSIRVSPIQSSAIGTELSIRSIPVQPAVERPPADVVEAKLREARKYAQ